MFCLALLLERVYSMIYGEAAKAANIEFDLPAQS
jgi:hypothetical protein